MEKQTVSSKITKILLACFMLVVIVYPILANPIKLSENMIGALKTAKTAGINEGIAAYEAGLEDILTLNRTWLDIYGLSQRLSQKHEINDFKILKDNNGYLYDVTAQDSEKTLDEVANAIKKLYETAESQDTSFLFVQCPYKSFSKIDELSDYAVDYRDRNEDALIERLKGYGIPILDVRKYLPGYTYYKTDHHWTIETAFETASMVVSSLNRMYHLNMDPHNFYSDLNNYETVTYKNSFLGSFGIKTGKYYTGKDDFSIIVPTFDTYFEYSYYNPKGELSLEKRGDFWKALINQKALDYPEYLNKYNAILNLGYVENRIVNTKSDNDLKAMVVSQSYGRALTQYLCVYFKETRFLDPQEGRFSGSLLTYLKDYQPDVLIFMYNYKMNVADE